MLQIQNAPAGNHQLAAEAFFQSVGALKYRLSLFAILFVISFNLDGLVIIAKILTKQGTTAYVCSILGYLKAEGDVAVVVNV